MIVLKDKADMGISVITKISFLEFCKIVTVDLDAAARDIVETADQVQ